MKTNTITQISTRKVLMWIGIVSIIMLFAGLTSAYVVRQAEGNWLHFALPKMFWMSTGAILLSSATLNMANGAAKQNNQKRVSQLLGITLILGVAFMVLQLLGWSQLVSQGVYFAGSNAAGSFLYAITGIHLFHMIAAAIALVVTTANAVKGKYTPQHIEGLQVFAIFWHFLGALWVYLFFFLLLVR